uniref:Putative ovule protein n=1 Tax=Solanum chacoense TaxID=4108 RepID=A0A0V0IRT3_SOLCH
MEHCSGENADITEWEIDDYKEKSYVKLKCGNQSFKISDVAYTCPYCPEKRGRHLFYEDLLQHASGIGKSTIRTARDRAKHLALAKYLEGDVAGAVGPSNSSKELKSGSHSFRISDVAFACPYCPETTKRDFSYKDLLQHANGIGSSNSFKRTARDKANHLALVKHLENDVAGSASSSKSYEEWRSGSLKISNMAFACPYCPETRNRHFSYIDLFQHVNSVGTCNSITRTASDRAKHLALAKSLENDVAAGKLKSYEGLKSGNSSLKISDMTSVCAYPETRNGDSSYKDLWQQASGVGSSNSKKQTARDKGNHLAYAKYLESDVAGAVGASKSYEESASGKHSFNMSDRTYACAYCPETRNRDFSYNDLWQHALGVGSCDSKKRTARIRLTIFPCPSTCKILPSTRKMMYRVLPIHQCLMKD